jgi:hypothetical protein
MPIPLLATLSATARAAYPIIKGGVARGLSANAIQGVLRAQSLGIRRQTLLDIIRAENNIERAQAALRYVGLNRIPNPNRLPQALTRLRRRYSFVVEIAGRAIETGESILQNVTVSLDTVLTRGEIERLAEEAVLSNMQTYGLEIDRATLTSGLQAGIAGTL